MLLKVFMSNAMYKVPCKHDTQSIILILLFVKINFFRVKSSYRILTKNHTKNGSFLSNYVKSLFTFFNTLFSFLFLLFLPNCSARISGKAPLNVFSLNYPPFHNIFTFPYFTIRKCRFNLLLVKGRSRRQQQKNEKSIFVSFSYALAI